MAVVPLRLSSSATTQPRDRGVPSAIALQWLHTPYFVHVARANVEMSGILRQVEYSLRKMLFCPNGRETALAVTDPSIAWIEPSFHHLAIAAFLALSAGASVRV